MSAEGSADRLLELTEAYLDDELGDGEGRELRALVQGDGALRERFVAEVRWHIRLANHLRAPGIPLSRRVDAVLEAGPRGAQVADAVARRIAPTTGRRNRVSTRFVRRRRRELAPWWLAAAALVLLSAVIGFATTRPSSSAATARGAGLVERGGAALRLGDQPRGLADGDVLVAGGAGLELRFADGTAVALAEGARLRLRSGAVAGAKALELAGGSLRARVARQPAGAALVVSTPHADATVLGTVFRLGIETAGTRLTVEEGRIAFARLGGGEAIEVVGGRSALAGAAGGLALVEPARTRPAWVEVPFTADGGRPFAADSPYNLAIPQRPALDPGSAAMAAQLAEAGACLALVRHGLPVYDATAETPLRTVTVTRRDRPAFPDQVRIPEGALPNNGSNRSLVVLDWSAGRAVELYHAEWLGAELRVDSGGQLPFAGDGIPRPPSGYAGGSYLAGLLRVRELERGAIPHALAFGTRFAQRGSWRHPAQQTDGKAVGPGTIPVGARIQLDPALDLDAIAGLTPGERAIAEALQTHGAYCVGMSDEPFLFFCERARDATDAGATGRVYAANGFASDGATLPHIPWRRLRVLQRWDGTPE